MASGMSKLAGKSAAKVDAKFAQREAQLIKDTSFDWDAIKPKLADEAEYAELMAVVQEATDNNESLGQLVGRLKDLGAGGLALVDKVKGFVVA
jgi:hypothetical protein